MRHPQSLFSVILKVTIGQRGGLSPSDVQQMNLMYNCKQGTNILDIALGTNTKPRHNSYPKQTVFILGQYLKQLPFALCSLHFHLLQHSSTILITSYKCIKVTLKISIYKLIPSTISSIQCVN